MQKSRGLNNKEPQPYNKKGLKIGNRNPTTKEAENREPQPYNKRG